MIEELEDLFYDTFHRDKIEISINEYEEDNIIIYKNENNIPSKHKNIIAEYARKYALDKNHIDTISTIINRYIWDSAIVTKQNQLNLNLIDEANKIYDAIKVLQESNIFKSIEPNYDDCYMNIIKRYTDLANDLFNLGSEKTHIQSTEDIKKEYEDNSNYLYTIIRKYPKLNPMIVLSAFTQAKNTLATELAYRLISYIKEIKNINKDTKSSKIKINTVELIQKLFDIKVSDRDFAHTNKYLSTTRHYTYS